MRQPPRLIVNADDFGLTAGINRGIGDAHERGILTSTSLMVLAPAAEDAAKLSLELPKLGVGLHAVTRDGMSPFAGPDELERQLVRFEELTGGPPTHLDSHHNVHFEPSALPAFQSAAQRLRIPLRGHSAARHVSSFYGRWGGESHPEQVSPEHLVRMLAGVRPGWTELACHPGYLDRDLHSSYAAERELEVASLCDARVRCAVEANEIELASFAMLASEVTP